jgi:hypothetical protein
MIEIVVKVNGKSEKLVTVCDIFYIQPMLNIKFRAGAVGTGAVSRCSFGSTKIKRLLEATAPQQCPILDIYSTQKTSIGVSD